MSDASCFVLLAEEILQTEKEGFGYGEKEPSRVAVAGLVRGWTPRVFGQVPRRSGWWLTQMMELMPGV